MSLYSAYLYEREGLSVLEMDEGFAVYKVQGPECYLQDIYVVPEHRKEGFAKALADSVVRAAKLQGCRYLIGSVSPEARGSHASLLVILAYGMRLKKAEKDIIYFVKEI